MELDEIPEVEPIPTWDDAELHEQAHTCVQWITRTLREAGLGDEVFERRAGAPAEIRKLIETLRTHGRMRRIDEPGVIWTCVERLGSGVGHTERERWCSALYHAYYVEKHNLSSGEA